MNDYQSLAQALFPNVTVEPASIDARFPKRNLSAEAAVTRIAPSPTGSVHLGNLYNAVIAERLAHQSGGVFYLRIEDTDQKREVPGAVETVIDAMAYFGVYFDEGATETGEKGNYGPYRQRQRKDIYQVYAKWLVLQGLAYPCFCTAGELDAVRQRQAAEKKTTGYYGAYAACRHLTNDDVLSRLEAGQAWVLRYRAVCTDEKIRISDAVRGALEMPRNDMDFVLLKSDGIPTYHFAHVVDDHLMQTTYVIRGEEWLSSLPMHVELFRALHWPEPIYCHTATLMKMDGSSKRKLSKRHDPELALAYYKQEGIAPDAVWSYLLTILNSNFEQWQTEHPLAGYRNFPFSMEYMSSSGALMDLAKLYNISKDVISQLAVGDVYGKWLDWCCEYRPDMAGLIRKYPEKTLKALQIGRSGEKRRKDLYSWKQACAFMSFYYDETFTAEDSMPPEVDKETQTVFLMQYLAQYNHQADAQSWFEGVKTLSAALGFALKPKDYKKAPQLYKGSIVHTTNMLRIALTGRVNAPDIWEVSQVLGEETVRRRIGKYLP